MVSTGANRFRSPPLKVSNWTAGWSSPKTLMPARNILSSSFNMAAREASKSSTHGMQALWEMAVLSTIILHSKGSSSSVLTDVAQEDVEPRLRNALI